MPFIGSCLGHAGHPIYQADVKRNNQRHKEQLKRGSAIPEPIWVDLSPKFPATVSKAPGWKNPRPKLGNHGFCVLALEPDRVTLTYHDWLQRFKKNFIFKIWP
jgi:hypothetical protein